MRRLDRARSIQAVVLSATVLATLFPIDEAVHDLVFRYLVSHEVRLFANGFTILGTTGAGVGALGALAVVAHRTADGLLWQASIGGLAGLALGGLATQGVKQVMCRARPRLVEGWGVGSSEPPDDPVTRGFLHWPCFARGRYQSFPSGHAATAFTVAAVLTAAAPARRSLWIALAAGVGASRVLLNAHFVSDVLGGGLIGWWAAGAGRWLAHRWAPRLGRSRSLGAGSSPGSAAAADPAETPTSRPA